MLQKLTGIASIVKWGEPEKLIWSDRRAVIYYGLFVTFFKNNFAATLKIPPDAIIPLEKLTRYLLVPRVEDDKSRFLAQAGFTQENPEALRTAIRLLVETTEASEDSSNQFGDFYRIEGELEGREGYQLPVVLIWLRWYQDGTFHFITLKPWRKSRDEA